MLGKGLFERVGDPKVSSQSKFDTWIMTPKYNDPYSGDTTRAMAKFLIDKDLEKAIKSSTGEGDTATSANNSGDRILSKLSTNPRGYFDFFMQSVDEVFDEKFQVVETLGDSYAVFGLGQKPKIFSCSGVLLNSKENDWRINFIKMFEKYISVSKLASFNKGKNKNQVTLVYDSVSARGAILNLRTQLRSENELSCSFAFTILVTKYTPINSLGSRTELTNDSTSFDTDILQEYPKNSETQTFEDIGDPPAPLDKDKQIEKSHTMSLGFNKVLADEVTG